MQEFKTDVQNASDVDLDSLTFYDPDARESLSPERVVNVTLDDGATVSFLVRNIPSTDVLAELPVHEAIELQQDRPMPGADETPTEEQIERAQAWKSYHRQAVLMGLVRPELDESQIEQLPNRVCREISEAITGAYLLDDADVDGTSDDATES